MSAKHDHIASMLDAGHTDEEVIASTTRWKIRLADLKHNRRHYNRVTRDASRPRSPQPDSSSSGESEEERLARITRQYATLGRMADRIISGQLPALIVSGPPGLGKTYTIETALAISEKEHDIIRGSVSAAGLYIALYHQREGGVVVLDDCDSVFRDEQALNILKIALDSSDKRTLSWRKLAAWLGDMDIPSSFDFAGSVVFCTNLDFEAEINRGSKMAVHYQALVDRSLYLSLTLRTSSDYLCRIRQVVITERQFEKRGLTEEAAEETMKFIEAHAVRFYTLSIRSALQVAACRLMALDTWRDDVMATKMRTL